MSEPWLSGPMEGVNPLVAPLIHSFTQVREDAAAWTEPLTTEQLWAEPHGAGSVGFHIRHAGGAAERLCTYLQGQQLSDEQLAAMKAEKTPGATRADLLAELNRRLDAVEAAVKSLNPATYSDPRGVGRKMLPTTVMGLIVHIAEHTQRHVGEAIVTAKWARVL
ncbi:MAG TPA: DinB family protein [Bryobacteraceae bacterium]|jgi:DinB family protein|nr:DinB family protein [Bryobacteraceae bacterium]